MAMKSEEVELNYKLNSNLYLRDFNTHEVIKWCNEKFGVDNWDIDPICFYFKSEEDRTLFILTWT